jgi:ABC-type multidrug transport system fused ATPase/permease subunit
VSGTPPQVSLTRLLGQLVRQLPRRRRVELALLFALVIVSSVAEVVSLGAVVPFIGMLVAPEQVYQSERIREIAGWFGIASAQDLVLPATLFFIAAAVVAAAIRILQLHLNTRLAFAIGADLGVTVYRRTLYQPYLTHVARNSSEIVGSITRKVDHVVTGVLLPALTFISSLVLVASIGSVLFLIDPMAAAVASVGFGLCYGILTYASRQRIRRLSEEMAAKQVHVFKAIQEGLSGIRDVLLGGTQERYAQMFHEADVPLRRAYGAVLFISAAPRYAMEALGMILIALLAYVLATRPEGAGAALPTLAALALGGQRLLPGLQQAYAAWSSMMGGRAVLRDIVQLLDQPLPPQADGRVEEPLPFAREIRFEGAEFRYDTPGPWILRGIDLTIAKGERIGIVGPTGSGKSTLIDMLLGLFPPTAGRLLVDGVPIEAGNVRRWQRNIRHVPQSIYLADASFAENIALGEPAHEINLERVARAARRAQIADFIESAPQGYDTRAGEDGVRMSGGQRQRLGIARALYGEASVLVFDEATSALDTATESSVMQAIESLDSDLTIVLIAHRVSTLRNCNRIIELKEGQVAREGTFDQFDFDRRPHDSELPP